MSSEEKYSHAKRGAYAGSLCRKTICLTAIHQYLHKPAQIVTNLPTDPPITFNNNSIRDFLGHDTE